MGAKELVYACVACNYVLHLDTCTELSTVAINGIKEIGANAMLICNTCLGKNKRDKFIKGRALVDEQSSKVDIDWKLKNVETLMNNMVERKLEEALNKTHEKVTRYYASAVISVQNASPLAAQIDKKSAAAAKDHDILKIFRISGIPEDVEKTKDENLAPTTEEVKKVTTFLGVEPQITEMRRLGKFNRERVKPRTLLVTLSNEYEKKLVLPKAATNDQSSLTNICS